MSDARYPVGRYERVDSLNADERTRMIVDIAACPAEMRRALSGLSDGQLDTPYRDGGWTLRQVAHHVPDSHMNAYIRHKLAVTEEQPTVKSYTEGAWAELVDGKGGPIEVSLTLLTALHDRWTRFLRSLSEEQFARTFLQPEVRGPIRLDQSLAMYAWHSRHHVAHIDHLRQRMGW